MFKSIELVSIILRFICPRDYGIISPPVERILDVRRGSDAVETYLNYLGNLRSIRAHYGFGRRAADADMALWVLHERCYGSPADSTIARQYHNDRFMLRLRVRNLVTHLVRNRSYAQIADALEEADPALAALVACHVFERHMRALAETRGATLVSQNLEAVIESISAKGPVTSLRKGHWHRLRRVRNGLVHEGRVPLPRDIADLLEELVRLEEEFPLPRRTP